MALDKLVDSAKLDACLDAEADAIRAKTGGSSELPFDYANDKGFADAIAGIPSGGTTITDGIAVKSRDADGYATEIDFYGTIVQPFQFFGQNINNTAWKSLRTINWQDTVTAVKNNAFMYANQLVDLPTTIGSVGASGCANMAALQSVNMPNLTSVNVSSFYGCAALESVVAPKLVNLGYNNVFANDRALNTVQIGSVGYGLTNISASVFTQDTQSGLTITIYTTGSYADTAVSRVRSGATNATIVIKAAEATTYNGTSYAAGDTILTSEVT